MPIPFDTTATALFDERHRSMHATAEALTTRAAAALRPGVTSTDLLALTSGGALTARDTPHARHLTALLKIRRRRGTPSWG